jgi:magnesium transporter
MIMHFSTPEPTRVTCIDYSAERCQVQEIEDIPSFLESHRPTWSQIRWINVDRLSDIDVVEALAEKYQLHPLALEDVVHTVERPKVEDYQASEGQPGRLFIVARSVEVRDDKLLSDQISIFLGRSTLLSFQTLPGDSFDPIRRRLQVSGSQLRENGVSFLLYALLDAIVDSYFPILEVSNVRLEELEEELLSSPGQRTLERVHIVRRDLLLLRRAAWPMREVIAQLQRDKHECLAESTRPYFRDIYDHCVQIIDLIDNYREIAAALTETYLSVVSSRLNEIMKVLTVIGTVFLPLTFLAGVYGMNMPIPENQWWFSYPVFWLTCAVIAGTMIYWFRKRGWV